MRGAVGNVGDVHLTCISRRYVHPYSGEQDREALLQLVLLQELPCLRGLT